MNSLRLIAALIAMAALAACSNPEADWQQAESENTEAAYQAFLEKHPEGEWAQQAQTRLDGIKDGRDWENAQVADSIDAYNNYLLAHPLGAHMGEARQRISELETEAAWLAAQGAGTREALEDFLLRYADTPQAELARTQLAALNPPPPPPAPAKKPVARSTKQSSAAPAIPKGGFQVQLGAFSSLSKAQSEQARIEKRFRATTGPLSIQKPSGGDQLYRLKTAGMTESAARSACQKLKGAGQDCVVVRR